MKFFKIKSHIAVVSEETGGCYTIIEIEEFADQQCLEHVATHFARLRDYHIGGYLPKDHEIIKCLDMEDPINKLGAGGRYLGESLAQALEKLKEKEGFKR